MDNVKGNQASIVPQPPNNDVNQGIKGLIKNILEIATTVNSNNIESLISHIIKAIEEVNESNIDIKQFETRLQSLEDRLELLEKRQDLTSTCSSDTSEKSDTNLIQQSKKGVL